MKNPPGQWVNNDVTLADYIARKTDTPIHNISPFRRWAADLCYLDYDCIEDMEEAFNAGYLIGYTAAQENK